MDFRVGTSDLNMDFRVWYIEFRVTIHDFRVWVAFQISPMNWFRVDLENRRTIHDVRLVLVSEVPALLRWQLSLRQNSAFA